MKAITIYPRFDVLYYSFYIQGLRSVFGARNITYSSGDFPKFEHPRFAFIVNDGPERKIVIAAEDAASYDLELLDWCDMYAKINIDPDTVPENYAAKVTAIGPSFGLHVYSFIPALYHSLKTLPLAPNPRDHFANYYRQLRYRFREHFYQPGVTKSDYIFFAGSLWKGDAETNRARALFIATCRAMTSIRFEGGFVPRLREDIHGYEHLTVSKRYSYAEYMRKTKASAVVFNTPAVGKCHGWKLGEFLALGKAIISTPLTRLLPARLIHGKHIHYIEETPESIESAVQLICRDEAYRRKLEQGAREYYLEYLSPVSVINRILTLLSPLMA